MRHETEFGDINIGDILRLALPLDTVLLGGSAQTRHRVNWVAVLSSWGDLESQLNPNDLVLIPEALQQSLAPADREAALRPLAEMNASGLVFFSPVDEATAALLDSLNLPALIIPPTTSMRDIHQKISLLLLDRQAATSDRAMQLYRQLSEMSREGQGLDAMTEVMSKLTGNIVVVQDKRMDIQAISWPSNSTVDREALIHALQQREELPPVLLNRKAAARSRQSYWQQLLPIEGMGRLISPIVSGDRARGYLSVVGPATDLDLLDSLTVEHGAAAAALEMAKAKAVSEAKKSLRGDFLEGLLAGTLPRKEIDRLESRLDHDTRELHAAMTIAWTAPDAPSLRRLETSLHWVLTNHPRPALVHIFGNQHIVVFQALKSADDMESAQLLGRRLIEQIQAEFQGANILIGMSGPARSLVDWQSTYEESLQAMQLAQRLAISNQVVEFKNLGVYKLLYELEGLAVVRRFTEEILRPLVEYDTHNRGSLVTTVDAYFNHHGNISQTAESLFVHRNTLLYRMDRIQELTNMQLEDANMRLALHLALKLWQLRPESERS